MASGIILNKAAAIPQDVRGALRETDRLHYSWEIPGNGVFCLQDSGRDIYRLLRAVDYGLNRIFPYVKCVLDDGRCVEIVAYKKVRREDGQSDRAAHNGRQTIWLVLDGEHDLRLQYRGTD